MNGREIKFAYDVTKERVRNYDDNTKSAPEPFFHFVEEPSVTIQFLNIGAAAGSADIDYFTASLDGDFDQATTIVAHKGAIPTTDWASGEISFTMPTNTTAYASFIGDEESLPGYLEISGYYVDPDPQADDVRVFNMVIDVELRNTVYSGTPEAELIELPEYLTADEMAAQVEATKGYADLSQLYADGTGDLVGSEPVEYVQSSKDYADDSATSAGASATSAGNALTSETNANNSAIAAAADAVLTGADATQTALDVISTGADVTQTGLDVVATGADAAQTALDVIATNADVVLTNADVVLTHADVVLTGADVDTTNADVLLTNADVTATNADVVTTNADVVTTNADVVLTHADVLLTNADVVTTNADAAQTALDAIATNADTTQTALDVIATNADVVTTNADAVATGLDVIATNADVVATNADVVSTNADVVSTNADAAQTALDVIATNADVVSTNDDVIEVGQLISDFNDTLGNVVFREDATGSKSYTITSAMNGDDLLAIVDDLNLIRDDGGYDRHNITIDTRATPLTLNRTVTVSGPFAVNITFPASIELDIAHIQSTLFMAQNGAAVGIRGTSDIQINTGAAGQTVFAVAYDGHMNFSHDMTIRPSNDIIFTGISLANIVKVNMNSTAEYFSTNGIKVDRSLDGLKTMTITNGVYSGGGHKFSGYSLIGVQGTTGVTLPNLIFAGGAGYSDDVIIAKELSIVTLEASPLFPTLINGDTRIIGKDFIYPFDATHDEWSTVSTVAFEYTDSRFFGEKGLPDDQGWTVERSANAPVTIVEETFFGIPQDVVKFADDAGDKCGAEKPITVQQWQDAYDFGATFSGTLRLDTTDGSGGCFIGMQANSAENPHPTLTGDRRYGTLIANDGGYIRLDGADSGHPLLLTLDGTNGNPAILFDEEFTIEVIVPPTLGDADIYVNGVLLSEKLPYYSNTGGKGTHFLVTSGSGGGTNRVFYVANFGGTIYEDSATKIIPAEALNASTTQVITASGRRNHTVVYPEGYPGRPVGDNVVVSATNVGAYLIFKNENSNNINFTVNGLNSTSTLITEAGSVIATNTEDGGNTYSVQIKSYYEGIANNKDLDLGTGAIIAQSGSIANNSGDAEFTIESDGNVALNLIADRDNAAETDTPHIYFSNDGGGTEGVIGQGGVTNFDAQGNVLTGAGANDLTIHSLTDNVQIGSRGVVGIDIGDTSIDNKLLTNLLTGSTVNGVAIATVDDIAPQVYQSIPDAVDLIAGQIFYYDDPLEDLVYICVFDGTDVKSVEVSTINITTLVDIWEGTTGGNSGGDMFVNLVLTQDEHRGIVLVGDDSNAFSEMAATVDSNKEWRIKITYNLPAGNSMIGSTFNTSAYWDDYTTTETIPTTFIEGDNVVVFDITTAFFDTRDTAFDFEGYESGDIGTNLTIEVIEL